MLVSRKTDGGGVVAEEGAPVDALGPARYVASLECIEQRCLHLGGFGNRSERRGPAFPFALQARAERSAPFVGIRCHGWIPFVQEKVTFTAQRETVCSNLNCVEHEC